MPKLDINQEQKRAHSKLQNVILLWIFIIIILLLMASAWLNLVGWFGLGLIVAGLIGLFGIIVYEEIKANRRIKKRERDERTN